MTENKHQATEIRWLNRGQIVIGDLQPRKHFEQAKIDNLVASLKEHGFDDGISRLLVRPLGEARIEHEEDSTHWFIQRRAGDGQWRTVDTAETPETAEVKRVAAEVFELVLGECRYRGSEIAGIELVPVAIQEMDDLTALKKQLVENMQRAELTPMEEAMAFARMREMGQTQAMIAAAIGRKEPFVQSRLVLCRLAATPIAGAIERGEITATHGEVLARVPSAPMRNELLQKILSPPDGSPSPWSVKALDAHIKLDYVIDLRAARFDPDDKVLVPVEFEEGFEFYNERRLFGGPCGDCPYNTTMDELAYAETPIVIENGDRSVKVGRSENSKGGIEWYFNFEDRQLKFRRGMDAVAAAREKLGLSFEKVEKLPAVASPMCTNPQCFQMKEIAAHERWRGEVGSRKEEAGNADVVTLSHAENAELWNESGRALAFHSPYVEMDQAPAASELRADVEVAYIWRHLIKGQAVSIILGRDTAGKVHELVRHDLAKKAAHLNGHKIFRDSDREQRTDRERSSTAPAPTQSRDERSRDETLATQAEQDREREIQQAEMAAIVEAAEGAVRKGHVILPKPFWAHVALSLATAAHKLELLDPILTRRGWSTSTLVDEVKEQPLGARLGLVVELLAAVSGDADVEGGAVDLWADVFGVKLAQVRKKLEKAAAQTEEKKAA